MKLSDLLDDAWVVVPAQADDLGGVLRVLLARVSEQGQVSDGRGRKLARDLAFGSHGEVVRINERIVAAVGTLESLARPSIGVAVAPEPFGVTAEGRPEPATARAVVLVLTSARPTDLRRDIVSALARALRDTSTTDQLLAARSVADIRFMQELMETEVHPRLVVADALVPVRYRIYPDTPLGEVVDLMVRRGVHAVPVVGERYEVLGILTAGDALGHLLREGRRSEGTKGESRAKEPTARDFMTRTVLCVSEEQALIEAANMMVNRDVEQIPVVREGELVGFVTRDSILKVLYGNLDTDTNQEEESESDS